MTSEILKIMPSGIPKRSIGKLYIELQLEFHEFQLEEMEKEQDQKLEIILIQLMEIDAAVKSDSAIFTTRIAVCVRQKYGLLSKALLLVINIINMIVETGMKMRFGGDEIFGDSRFFVFLGSKSKFLLS